MVDEELSHVWITDHNGDLKMFPADNSTGYEYLWQVVHEGPKCKLCDFHECTGCNGIDGMFSICPSRNTPLFDL